MDETGGMHMRQDMRAMIMCDNKSCGVRGEYARCYLVFYKNCDDYKSYERRMDNVIEHFSGKKMFDKVRREL
jgi:hypothetical protein